jgi:hypothetical protein
MSEICLSVLDNFLLCDWSMQLMQVILPVSYWSESVYFSVIYWTNQSKSDNLKLYTPEWLLLYMAKTCYSPPTFQLTIQLWRIFVSNLLATLLRVIIALWLIFFCTDPFYICYSKRKRVFGALKTGYMGKFGPNWSKKKSKNLPIIMHH